MKTEKLTGSLIGFYHFVEDDQDFANASGVVNKNKR